jgi:hypothetical protein
VRNSVGSPAPQGITSLRDDKFVLLSSWRRKEAMARTPVIAVEKFERDLED